jgi:signal transduction histidine kinase
VIKIIFRQDTTWALTETGTIIKIKKQEETSTGYTPHLYLAYVKKGRDTIRPAPFYKFSWFDNDLSFYFAATSFYQESQIQYAYRLSLNGDATWSELSPNASISFVNLAPGNYILQTRVSFPAGRYADEMIEIPVTIIPPWWRTTWFTLLVVAVIIVLSLAVMRIYVRRKLTRQRIVLEKQQAIQKERTRIATDMHDDLGAGLSRIKFLSEMVLLKQRSQRDTEEDISRIGDHAREMIGKMGEIVWALNEKNDSVSSLVAYTRSYAAEYLTQNGIAVSIQTPETYPDVFVTGEIRRNIFLTVKEALHNLVKHAQADNVKIDISVERNILITIADNGIGIDQDNIRPFSNGITNMQKRIHEIGGTLEIKNSSGTKVCINVPVGL